MEHYDIAICGGGLTGLLLANLLKDTRYRIAVIDAGSEPQLPESQASEPVDHEFESGYAPRVSALNSQSVGLLARCGAYDQLARVAPFTRMEIKDGEGIGEICFDAAELGTTQLGVVVENHLVLRSLYEELVPSSVEILFEHNLENLERFDQQSELDFASQPAISAELLIAADGGNSKVRELRGGKSFGWQYDQTAIVTTLRVERPHQNIPRQWFTEFGPLAFLPLAAPNLISIVWSHSAAQDVLSLSPKTLCERLTEASECELGQVLAVDRRFSFPLRQHHAARYTEAGIALIGDAAHTIHPLAGQGANLGFADAAALAGEIRQAIFSEQQLSDPRLLRNFALKRQPHNLAIAAAMEAIKHLYGAQNPMTGFIRNQAMKLLNENQTLKSLMMKVASDGAV